MIGIKTSTRQTNIDHEAWPPPSDIQAMHLAARQEWNERYGSYIAEKNTWRLVAAISLVIALISVAGSVYMATQNKVVPYIISVDKLGAVMPAQRADVANQPSALAIRAHLARWVTNARSVYFDAVAQRKAIEEVYASVNRGGSARSILDEFYKKNQPFKIAEEQQVTAQVHSVLPLSDKTYRVEWKEEHRGKDGRILSSMEHQAVVTVTIVAPKDEATILVNPLGVYITSFSWGQRL